jgi:VanZ family protein
MRSRPSIRIRHQRQEQGNVDLKHQRRLLRKPILHAVAMAPLLAIGLLSVLPGHYRPHIFELSQFEHMAAYIGAATALALIYASELKVIRVVVFLGAFGAAFEVLQIWIPGRNASFVDVADDVAGALIGTAVAMMVARVMPKVHTKLMILAE